MESPQSILFVTSEKQTSGPTPNLSTTLAKAGYQVMIANVSEIESVVTRYAPALVIASLPGLRESDLQLCRLLLHLISAPVMVISPLDDVDGRIAALDAGIVDYRVSPVSPLEVAGRVRNILERQSRNKPLQKDPDLLHKEAFT